MSSPPCSLIEDLVLSMAATHHLLQLLHKLLYFWLINCCSAHMAATLLLRLQKEAPADLQWGSKLVST
jgi:hypothetical protein